MFAQASIADNFEYCVRTCGGTLPLKRSNTACGISPETDRYFAFWCGGKILPYSSLNFFTIASGMLSASSTDFELAGAGSEVVEVDEAMLEAEDPELDDDDGHTGLGGIASCG